MAAPFDLTQRRGGPCWRGPGEEVGVGVEALGDATRVLPGPLWGRGGTRVAPSPGQAEGVTGLWDKSLSFVTSYPGVSREGLSLFITWLMKVPFIQVSGIGRQYLAQAFLGF